MDEKMPRPKHICNSCVHFVVTTCCEKAVCAELNWDADADDSSQDVEDFLWEQLPENECEDYKNDDEWAVN